MFPGGPRRQEDPSDLRGPLRSGEEVEAGITHDVLDAKARRRRQSMFIALGVFGVLALTGGLYVGIQARITPEQLAEEQRAEVEPSDLDETARKLMDELWRMEEIEAARNRR